MQLPSSHGFGSSSPKTDIYSLGIVLREMLGSITPVPNIAPILHRLNMIADRCTQMTPSRKIPVCGRVKKMRIAVILSCAAQHFCCQVIQVNMHTITMINTNNTANADTAKRAIHDSASRFIPPGFRTRTPWKMLLSSVAYLFIIWLCLSLELENTYGASCGLKNLLLVCSYLRFSVALTISMYRIYCHFARAKTVSCTMSA